MPSLLMNIDPELWIVVPFVFFVIATLYAAVGFGGGSSYLALLSLLGVSFFFMRTNALLCNLIVVSGSSVLFYKNKLISFKEIFPFIITSIPMTFVGAILRLEETLFFIILGITLIASALALFWQTFSTKNETEIAIQYPTYFNYVLGGAIGLLSGLVGIGGGVFLAPILNHLKWGKPIKIAGLTAFFIFANSISGLIGLAAKNTLEVSYTLTLPLLLAVFLGGQLGVRYSIKKNSSKFIKIFTGILVFIVGIRIFVLKGLLA